MKFGKRRADGKYTSCYFLTIVPFDRFLTQNDDLAPSHTDKNRMRRILLSFLVSTSFLFAGCSTSQQVTLARMNPGSITSVAQVPQDGNSPEMDGHLVAALQLNGLATKSPLPAGTRTAADVDAIVSYGDVWRWDLVMYLRSLSVRLYDAKNGDLLAIGEWKDSTLHGFRDAKLTMEGLVTEMVTKVRAASK